MEGFLGLFAGGAKHKRIERLAARIDALAEKDESVLRNAREIAEIRRAAAVELHAECAAFVAGLNRMLARPEIRLDPPEFSTANYREEGPNLFQINVRGRILQVEFESSPVLVSTEDFRVPYTMQGELRLFNQDLLDRDLVEERLLFYCLEGSKRFWRVFDLRTSHSGHFNQEYLVGLMERLI